MIDLKVSLAYNYFINFSFLLTPSIPPIVPNRKDTINFKNVKTVKLLSILIIPALKIIKKNINPLLIPLIYPLIGEIFEHINPVTNAHTPHIIVRRMFSTVLLSIPVLLIIIATRLSKTIRVNSPTIKPTTKPFMYLNLLNPKVMLFKKTPPNMILNHIQGN